MIPQKVRVLQQLPPVPSEELLSIYYEERKARITKVESATPKIKNENLNYIIPPAPSYEDIE